MSYVEDNLMPNEKVLYSARISKAIFIPSVITLLITIAVGIFTFNIRIIPGLTSSTTSLLSVMLWCFIGILFFDSILLGLQALVTMFTTEFAVTNRRVVAKTGFLRRHTLEMLLTKIESVAVNQKILERSLNYGSVTVTGTGGTKESFTAIAEPFAVRKVINQIIEQSAKAFDQQQKGPNPPGGGQ